MTSTAHCTSPCPNPTDRFYAAGWAHGRRLRAWCKPPAVRRARLVCHLLHAPAAEVAGPPAPAAPWRAQTWELMGSGSAPGAMPMRLASAPALVLLVHGWGGQARQFQAMAEQLWAAGLDPILLDMPAHGHSSGSQSHMPAFPADPARGAAVL